MNIAQMNKTNAGVAQLVVCRTADPR